MKKLILALALFLAWPVETFAAWHLYLIPLVGSPAKKPQYLAAGFKGECAPYNGRMAVLCAADVDAATDTTLVGSAGVLKIPDNLDQQIGAGALATVQSELQSRHIPNNWVTTTTTYRTVLRVYMAARWLLERYRVISKTSGPIFNGTTVTLSATFSSLPLAARNNLIATGASIGISTAGFTGASTLSAILKGVGDQLITREWTLGGITI